MKLCIFVAWDPFNGFSNSSKISDFPMMLGCPPKKMEKPQCFYQKLGKPQKKMEKPPNLPFGNLLQFALGHGPVEIVDLPS